MSGDAIAVIGALVSLFVFVLLVYWPDMLEHLMRDKQIAALRLRIEALEKKVNQ